MKTPRLLTQIAASVALSFAVLSQPVPSAAAEAEPSAKELAAKLNAAREDGNSYVRLRMEIQQPPGSTRTALQVQIKERRTRGSTEVLYQVLWPKERKGESVLVRGGGRGGFVYTPPEKPRTLAPNSMDDGIFGSDLAYADLVENFFDWDSQKIVGRENIGRAECVILESRPAGASSIYGSVKSWIDLRRNVTLRVEKFSTSGKLVRRIETTKVASDDKGRPIPANLSVRGPRGDASQTELDGSKIKHDVNFNDREFTPEGMIESAKGD